MPSSLFARLLLIWLIGLALVLALVAALFAGERDRSRLDAQFEGIAHEVASALDVLERIAPADRLHWIEQLGRGRLRFSFLEPPREIHEWRHAPRLLQIWQEAMPDHPVRIGLVAPRIGGERGGSRGNALQQDAPHTPPSLIAALQLQDGTPLLVRLPRGLLLQTHAPPTPERLLAAAGAFIAGLLILSWFAVRIATRPLAHMAEAARALGENPLDNPPLPERGPSEVQSTARAFNRMQTRIREYVAERSRILGAISHDLQTPVTRLRLRAELIDDEALRQKVVADLDAMQALVREGLDYARSLEPGEENIRVDVPALLEAIVEDAEEMGWHLELHCAPQEARLLRPLALRRALWNLIENGIKFGDRVEIQVQPTADCSSEKSSPHGLEITIRDYGQGIPAEQLERVFEPFYRLETSRNRDTGGSGLGLAIARNLIERQGGRLQLENHPDGGLVARVLLL